MKRTIQALCISLVLLAWSAWAVDVQISMPGTLTGEYSTWHQGTCPTAPYTVIVDNEPGVVIDNASATQTLVADAWTDNDVAADNPVTAGWHSHWHYLSADDEGDAMTYTPTVASAKRYDVFVWKHDFGTNNVTTGYSKDIPFTMTYSGGGPTTKYICSYQGGCWYPLGSYNFAAGTGGNVTTTDVGTGTYNWADAVWFRDNNGVDPIIIDRQENGGAGYSSTFLEGGLNENNASWGNYVDYATNAIPANKTVTYTPTIATAGWYAVYIWIAGGWEGGAYCDGQDWTVVHAGGSTSQDVDMDLAPGGIFKWLGNYQFAAGTGGYLQTDNECNSGTQTSLADAARFDYLGPTTSIAGQWERYISNGNAFDFTGGNYYRIAGNAGAGSYFRWRPTLERTGTYAIYVRIPITSALTRATVTYNIHSTVADYTSAAINQNSTRSVWTLVGYYSLTAGTDCYLELNADQGSANWIVADSAQFVLINGAGVETQANGFTDRLYYNPDFTDTRWQYWTADTRNYNQEYRSFRYYDNAVRLSYRLLSTGDPIILDDDDASYTGSWTDSQIGGYDHDCRYATESPGSPTATAKWTPTISTAGKYICEAFFPAATGDYADDAPFTTTYAGGGGGSDTNNMDQSIVETMLPTNHYRWNLLDVYDFAIGTGNYVTLTNDANDIVIADAVRFQQLLESTEANGLGMQFLANGDNGTARFTFGFFDYTAGAFNGDALYCYATQDRYVWDITMKIYDGANTDTVTVNRVLRPGQDYVFKLQYTAAAGLNLLVTDYNTGTVLINQTLPLANVSAFTVNSIGFGASASGGAMYTGIRDIQQWTGNSIGYRTAATCTFSPVNVDVTTLTTNCMVNAHRDASVNMYTASYGVMNAMQVATRYVGVHDRTYVDFIDNQLRTWALYYDHDTDAISSPVFTGYATDGHGVKGLIVSGYDGMVHVFGGTHDGAMNYYRGTVAEEVQGLQLMSNIDGWTTYPNGAWFDTGGEGRLMITYRKSATADLYENKDAAWAYSDDSGDNWTTGWLAKWKFEDGISDISYRLYPHPHDVSDDGVYYLAISKRGAASKFYGFWVVCYDGTNWMNPEGDILTPPLALPGVHTAVDSISGMSITCTTPSPVWTADYWIDKWVLVESCAACDPSIDGNWYKITDSDADGVTTDTDLDSLGLAVADTIFIGEKNTEVYYDHTETNQLGAAFLVVQGSGSPGPTGPQIWVVAGSGSYYSTYKYNYTSHSWDATLVDAYIIPRSFVAYDANNLSIFGSDWTGTGGVYDFYQWTSTNAGSTWTQGGVPFHEPYWGYTWISRANTQGSSIWPNKGLSTEAVMLFHNTVWPEGNFVPEELSPSSIYIWGPTNPNYLATHKLSTVSWDGDPVVSLIAAATQRGLHDETFTGQTVTDGDTDFTNINNYESAEHVEIQAVLSNGGAYNYIDNFLLEIGAIPSYNIMYHYRQQQ